MKNRKGIALVSVVFFLVIMFGLSAGLVIKMFRELKLVDIHVKHNQALYAAWGGTKEALDQLDTLINDYLLNTISDSNPSGVVYLASTKTAAGDGIGWLLYSVRDNNNPVLTQNGSQAEFSDSGMLGVASYQYTIIITEKTDPSMVVQDVWDFPFFYRIAVTSSVGGVSSQTMLEGDFTVRIQKDNFAKYALFTNSQSTQSGSRVWFTNFTNFAGPVHTNDRFNFAFNPSGVFEDEIDQVKQTARFYNNNNNILLDAANNGSIDVPIFNDSFDRGVSQVSFSVATEQYEMIDQATGNTNYSSDGIYVPSANGALTGGIYVYGNADITMSVDGSSNSVYTIVQGSTTKTVTVNRSTGQTTVVSGASTQTYSGFPDGVDDVGTLIYVNGSIDNLSGTVQSQTQLTVASTNDIKINGHIVYQDYTPAINAPGQTGYVPPNASGAENLLGIVSWQGDVRVKTSAPNNLQVHGSILAMNGVFSVDNHDDYGVGSRGTATLLGGVIQDNYGAFGQFNSSTGQQVSGYGRNFVYDARMKVGYAPPYFPSLSTFIAFTNDITDRLVWQEGK